ncbi:MAG: M23 family metallopeptidase [Myxococcaceae bacterium]
MFLRRTRGLLDLLLASLCLWAAYHHTPLGALLRSIAGVTFGVESSAQPLLAYYNGGVYGRAEAPSLLRLPPPLPNHGEVPAGEALAWGVFAALQEESLAGRTPAYQLARARGFDPTQLEEEKNGPAAYAKLLNALTSELGSEETAVAALVCGYEPARFAKDRLDAERAESTLEGLARQLPPGYEAHVMTASKALMLGTAYGLAWPVPDTAPMTSPFGVRMHPVLGMERMHTGIDLSVKRGTPIHVVAEGIVRRVSEDAVNGKVLTVDHGRGVTTSYCHNSEIVVTEGQRVIRRDLIAHSGNTGRSTGPHLHYQLELGRVPVDPLRFRVKKPKLQEPSP